MESDRRAPLLDIGFFTAMVLWFAVPLIGFRGRPALHDGRVLLAFWGVCGVLVAAWLAMQRTRQGAAAPPALALDPVATANSRWAWCLAVTLLLGVALLTFYLPM